MENFDDTGNPHENTRAARYPEGQGDPLPSTPDRPFTKRLGRLALPLLLIALTGFTAYNTLSVTGALRATFPNTQVFSIGVAYSFANSAGQVLLPGGQGNVTLTIQSAVSQPVTLFLSYNATDPNDWSSDSSNTGQSSGFNGPLTMSLGSVSRLAPVNTGFVYPVTSVAITVNPGVNNFVGTISVSPTASISGVFQLDWFANQ